MPAPQRSPRRRADELESSLREAVLGELLDAGYSGVTFERVARRAQTSKPVLYRRFRSRAHMVFESAFTQQDLDAPPATGSLREDMIAMLQAAQRRFRRIGASTYYGVLAEGDEELLRAVAHFADTTMNHILEPVLTAARERGEIGTSPIPAHIANAAIALLRDQMVVPSAHAPTIAEIVDDICLPLLRSAAAPHKRVEP